MCISVSTYSTTGKKQTGTLRISENIAFTNVDVMNYVIGTLQKKLPRAPLPFIPALGSGSTASAPLSDLSAFACTNGVWPPRRPVSVAQKNKPSTMLSSNVQSINLPMDCMAWRFWTMRQSNDCSTSAPRSKQWFEQLAQKKTYADTRCAIQTLLCAVLLQSSKSPLIHSNKLT